MSVDDYRIIIRYKKKTKNKKKSNFMEIKLNL